MDSGVSGRIARDQSTTAQRSRQGSKTAAGRKRSPRERADLDGENGVVAWVDTASPTSQHRRPTCDVRRHCRPDRVSREYTESPRMWFPDRQEPLSRPIMQFAQALLETIGTKRPSSISITTVVTVSGSSGNFNEKAS